MINPNKEIILIVIPPAYISAIAAAIDAGMPAATQKAVRALRKRNSNPTTSASPISPLSISRSNRPVIASARVRISSIVTPLGSITAISAATLSTLCWIPMASPPSERSIRTEIAGSSPTKYPTSRSEPCSITRATSPTSNDDPSALLRNTTRDRASALRFAVPVRTRALAPVTSPAGLASTSAAITAAISAMVMSWRISLVDGTSIRVCGAATP